MGFAYQLTDNGKIVLRGGYGIFFDRPNMRLYNSQLFNMPYEMLATALATPNENPFVQVPLPSAFPLNLSNTSIFPFGGYPAVLPVTLLTVGCARAHVTPVPATGLYPDLQDWSIPYVQTFNLGVQTSFANNWMLDLGYVGSAGAQVSALVLVQPGGLLRGSPEVTALGSLGGPFFPGFGNLTAPGLGSFLMESNSNSNYNSLQATAQQALLPWPANAAQLHLVTLDRRLLRE